MTGSNPVAAPRHDDPPGEAAGAPRYKLYSTASVMLATFLGSFLGGGALLALNLKRLGRRGVAGMVLLGSVAATALLIGAAFLVPSRWPNVLFLAVQLAIMGLLSQALMTRRLHEHTQPGGRLASSWGAAGIGLGALVLIVGVVLGVSVATFQHTLGRKVSAGNADVCYGDGFSEAQARQAAEFFADERRFGRTGTTRRFVVRITRGGQGSAACFVVQDGSWKDDDVMDASRQMMKESDPALFPRPLAVQLCDDTLEARRSVIIE